MTSPSDVVCAIDFSTGSIDALRIAVEIARGLGGRVHAVHAWQLPVVPSPEGHVLAGLDVADRIERDLREDLARVAREHARPGVAIDTHVVIGDPADVVVDRAKALGASTIVVGTHGRTGLPRAILGSVAERIVRTARGRVIVVPPRAPGAPPPALRRIACAVDFSEGSEAALREAVALAERADARITVVHCCAPPQYSSIGPALSPALERELQRELDGIVHRYAARRAPIDTMLRHGVPYAEIVAAADEIRADLVVVGTAGRTGLAHLLLGSVAERVVRTSHVPVMTVHLPEAS